MDKVKAKMMQVPALQHAIILKGVHKFSTDETYDNTASQAA